MKQAKRIAALLCVVSALAFSQTVIPGNNQCDPSSQSCQTPSISNCMTVLADQGGWMWMPYVFVYSLYYYLTW